MTDIPDLPPNVRKLERKEPEPPDDKWRFDQFVVAAFHVDDVIEELAKFDPDFYVTPANTYGDENQIRIEDIDRTSELGSKIDWLGGSFCDEIISFSIQPNGSLLRIIKISPTIRDHAAEASHVQTRFDADKAAKFVDYIIGEPGDDREAILAFLEIGEKERQEIAVIHSRFRRKHISLAKVALPHSKPPTDTSD